MRGAYRALGEGLGQSYVKAKGALNYSPGAKSIVAVGGVGADKDKMLTWHHAKAKWNGKVAARVYSSSLLRGLQVTYPGQNPANIDVLEIQRRSLIWT